MTPFQSSIIKGMQALFVTLIIAGMLLSALMIFDSTRYITITICTQVSPWQSECLMQKVTLEKYNAIHAANNQEGNQGR